MASASARVPSVDSRWLIVAIAVLAHDLLEGANTVPRSIAGGSPPAGARRRLLADAIAPLIDIGSGGLIHVPASTLAMLLAFFADGFLYIGASELLPCSRGGTNSSAKPLSVALGAGLIYLLVRLADQTRFQSSSAIRSSRPSSAVVITI